MAEGEEMSVEDTSISGLHITDASKYRLVYLYASPLFDPHSRQELRLLDTQQEIDLIRKTLKDSNRKLRFRVDVATPQNLRTVATLGVVMIHYSGHGSSDILAFENERGELHRLEVNSLRSLFSAGGVQTLVVFVSACHSEMAGRKFTEAGVPHVIALNNRVSDKSSRIFAETFYTSLFRGKKTIQEAFDIASEMVMVMEAGKPSDEKKFLLLPEDDSHNTIIFPNCPEGNYVDETDELAFNGCDRPLKCFIGRNRDMQLIFSFFVTGHKLVTIRGERGLGKTSLASKVCEYMNERRLFDAIYFVPLPRMGATRESDCNHLAEIFGQCMECETNEPLGIRNLDDLIRVLNNGGNGAVRDPRILFVVDDCNAFVTPSSSEDKKNWSSKIACAQPLTPSHHFVEATATIQKNTRPMGLIHFFNRLFRKTEKVKCLTTASAQLICFQDVQRVGESEKVISLDRLGDKQSAELIVKLSPRGLKPSEMNSSNPQNALDTLAKRQVVKDLEGHPRAIAIFCSILADEALDDSEKMRTYAKEALKAAKCWQEDYSAFAQSHQQTGPVHTNSQMPVALAVSSAPTTPVAPPRVVRSTSDSLATMPKHATLSASHSSGSLFPANAGNGHIFPKMSRLHQAQVVSPPRVTRKDQIISSTPVRLNSKNMDQRLFEQAQRIARDAIRDCVCADVWAKVTSLSALNNQSTIIPTSVRWSSLISALSESLEFETRVTIEVNNDANAMQSDASETRSVDGGRPALSKSMSRKLTKDDARFMFIRMQLEQAPGNSGQRQEVFVEQSRYEAFCEWWGPLLKSLSYLKPEFSCKDPIIIHGFLNRVKTESILSSKNMVGVFLLRFSESHPGYLVVSFTDTEPKGGMKVHHCLVNVGSDGVSIYFERGECKYSSLQELIMNCSNLVYLYPDIPKVDAFKETTPFR